MAYHTASDRKITCPRCEYDGWHIGCGLKQTYGFPFIDFDSGKIGTKGTIYRVVFNTDKEETEIKWDDIRYEYVHDIDAIMRVMEDTYGSDVWDLPNAGVLIQKHKVLKVCAKKYPQSITIKSLRWKITIQDIEKLLLLR